MFERYTERARRVLFFARYEASQLGNLSIETEHLLLGLLREGKGITNRIFKRAHVSLESLRRDIEGRTVFQEKIATSLEIPFSAETKRVLLYAMEEADRLLHDYIGTEHLLLGLLREERSVAASVLKEHGLRIDAVRDAIVELLKTGSATTQAPQEVVRESSPPYGVRVSPTGLRAPETSISSSPDRWSALGFELPALVARVYRVSTARIDCPVALDKGSRFDVDVVWPKALSAEAVDGLVQIAIQQHFQLAITRESRSMDVYVLTAPAGAGPALRARPEIGGEGATMWGSVRIASNVSINDLSGSGCTIGDLCRALEEELGRVFVDETNLTGVYDLEVRNTEFTMEGFLQTLRDAAGLVATWERRDVTMLVIRQ